MLSMHLSRTKYMKPHRLQVARTAATLRDAAGWGDRRRRPSPVNCCLAVGLCLMAVGCASSQGMLPAWMSGDAGKGRRSVSSSNPTPPPVAEASHVQSPPPETSQVHVKNDKPGAQAMQEYARDLASAKDAEKQGDLVGARSIYERLIGAPAGPLRGLPSPGRGRGPPAAIRRGPVIVYASDPPEPRQPGVVQRSGLLLLPAGKPGQGRERSC